MTQSNQHFIQLESSNKRNSLRLLESALESKDAPVTSLPVYDFIVRTRFFTKDTSEIVMRRHMDSYHDYLFGKDSRQILTFSVYKNECGLLSIKVGVINKASTLNGYLTSMLREESCIALGIARLTGVLKDSNTSSLSDRIFVMGGLVTNGYVVEHGHTSRLSHQVLKLVRDYRLDKELTLASKNLDKEPSIEELVNRIKSLESVNDAQSKEIESLKQYVADLSQVLNSPNFGIGYSAMYRYDEPSDDKVTTHNQ